MAKKVENNKGFLVLEINREEMMDKLSKYGCLGICDNCNNMPATGYYVAVLNRWLCKGCYDKFVRTVDRYPEDIPFEEKKFSSYCRLFDVVV